MKLSDYVQTNQLTAAGFARRIGISRSAVLRLMKGERRPSWAVLDRIVKETRGQVQPVDFLAANGSAPESVTTDGCLTGNASQAAPAKGKAA